MRSLSLLGLISGIILAVPAFAGTITYSVGGTYGSGVATNSLFGHPYTAPSAPWSLTFTVDQNPTPISDFGTGFSVPFSNLVYTLNGSDTGLTSSVSEIDFSDAADYGMFDVLFGSFNNSLGFVGAQMYSGTTAAPTMLAGNFTVDDSVVTLPFTPSELDGVFFGGGSSLDSFNGLTVAGTSNASGVPEPSTVAMMLGGALGLLALKRRRAA